MPWLIAHEATVIGLIWMLVLGPAVGNYACSVIYRLPIGKTPFERHPFCGHCNANLKPRDLFPILSWLSTGGKCRYCRGKIPGLYTVVEIACGILFALNFLHFGMGEPFLLYTAYGVFVIILAGIQWQQGWIAESIFTYALVCVALARTLTDSSINGWVHGGFIMLVATVALHRLVSRPSRGAFKPFAAPWIWWLVLMGTLVPTSRWALLSVPAFLLLAFALLPRRYRPLAVIPVAACALYLPQLL